MDLFQTWILGCAQPGFPGVYTDVSYHYEWISNTAYKYYSSLEFPYSSKALVAADIKHGAQRKNSTT